MAGYCISRLIPTRNAVDVSITTCIVFTSLWQGKYAKHYGMVIATTAI